jgi:small subunit ribosomal protein S16
MLKIRLARMGAKKNPNYALVVHNEHSKRDGQYLARIGQYFPKEKEPSKKLVADLDAVRAWQAKGAQVTQTVGQLLKTLAN